MAARRAATLSRREREIMDIIYRAGRATAADVKTAMASAPSYSAVRATLCVLEGKGHLKHERNGARYVYTPTVPRDKARRLALKHLLQTFFDGSTQGAVAALLDLQSAHLTAEELDRLAAMIDRAKEEGR